MRLARTFRAARRLPELARALRHFRRPYAVAAAYAGLPLGTPAQVELRDGTRIPVSSWHDLATAWVIFCREEYAVPPDARLVVDVGANVGIFALWASRAAPGAVLVCVEPFPVTVQQLRDNLAAWRLSDRCDVVTDAVTATAGVRQMDTSPGPSQSRGVLSAAPQASDGVAVSSIQLEQLLARAREAGKTSSVDLLKVDIEGSEHEVFHSLRPGALSGVKRLQLEFHPNGDWSALEQKLHSLGMRTTHITRTHPNSGVAHLVSSEA